MMHNSVSFLGEIVVTDDGALWLIGGGRLRFLFSKVWTVFCTQIRPGGGGLMEGVCNCLLTFLPLSSHMFILEGSGFFASNHFNSLAK